MIQAKNPNGFYLSLVEFYFETQAREGKTGQQIRRLHRTLPKQRVKINNHKIHFWVANFEIVMAGSGFNLAVGGDVEQLRGQC